jgi:hypothetical protein
VAEEVEVEVEAEFAADEVVERLMILCTKH